MSLPAFKKHVFLGDLGHLRSYFLLQSIVRVGTDFLSRVRESGVKKKVHLSSAGVNWKFHFLAIWGISGATFFCSRLYE